MVNEISNQSWTVGTSLGYAVPTSAQGGVTSPSVSETQRASGESTAAAPSNGINPTVSLFSKLTASKDKASDQARSVRQSGETLDQAQDLVNKLQKQLGMVKNYPPFPQGNEARVQYLKSIEGLRKELEAMSVPPLEDGQQVVIYPKQDKNAALDTVNATNSDLAALGTTLDQVQTNIKQAQSGVQDQARKLWNASDFTPTPVEVSSSVGAEVSSTVSKQLSATQLTLTTNSASLSLLGR